MHSEEESERIGRLDLISRTNHSIVGYVDNINLTMKDMKETEELFKLKKKLEADLQAVNRALALLEERGSDTSAKGYAALLFQPQPGKKSIMECFAESLEVLSGKEFIYSDVEKALKQIAPDREIKRNTLASLLWKAARTGRIKTVRPPSGRRPAVYTVD